MNFQNLFKKNKTQIIFIFATTLSLCLILSCILYALFGHWLIKAIYEGRSIGLLNRIIEGQATRSLEYYFEIADKQFFFLSIYLSIYCGIFLLLSIVGRIKINLILIMLSLAGIAFVLISTRYGVGITRYIIAFYISGGRSLSLGEGYLRINGTPNINFPPLFSTLLAVVELAGIDFVIGIRFINAFIFGLIVFFSGQLFLRHISSKTLCVLGVISVLLSEPLLHVSAMMEPEPLFVLLVILFAIYLPRFLAKKRLSMLFLVSIFAALSSLQRYAGIIVILTGIVLIFFFITKTSTLQRVKYAVFFGVISITPITLFFIRNYMLTSRLFVQSVKSPATFTFYQSIISAFHVLTDWFLPFFMSSFSIIRTVIGLFVLIIAVTGFRHKSNSQIKSESLQVRIITILMLSYIVFLIVTTATITISSINFRYLAPVYVFVMVLVFSGLDALSKRLDEIFKKKELGKVLVVFFCAFWLAFPLYRVYENVLFSTPVPSVFRCTTTKELESSPESMLFRRYYPALPFSLDS